MKKILLISIFLLVSCSNYKCDICSKAMQKGDINWLTNDKNNFVGEGPSFAHYCSLECKRERWRRP